LRVEVGWLGQCSKFGGASRELWHHAHGYGSLGATTTCMEPRPNPPSTPSHVMSSPRNIFYPCPTIDPTRAEASCIPMLTRALADAYSTLELQRKQRREGNWLFYHAGVDRALRMRIILSGSLQLCSTLDAPACSSVFDRFRPRLPCSIGLDASVPLAGVNVHHGDAVVYRQYFPSLKASPFTGALIRGTLERFVVKGCAHGFPAEQPRCRQ
jgi:hypothetical protein